MFFTLVGFHISHSGSVKLGTESPHFEPKVSFLVIFNTQTVFKLAFYQSWGTSLPFCEKVLNGFVYTLNKEKLESFHQVSERPITLNS